MIKVNGEEIELAEPVNLLFWLDSRGIDPLRIAVEYNGEIVSRAAIGNITLKDGDAVEIVVFMGGG